MRILLEVAGVSSGERGVVEAWNIFNGGLYVLCSLATTRVLA